MKNIFYKKFKEINDNVIVGIDEAGRGPVIGYLVYGALVSLAEEVETMDFHDSKVMSISSRELAFDKIRSSMSFAYKAIHPQYITENMLCYGKNLNNISFEAVFDILDEVYKTYSVEKVFVDTVGDPHKYREMLENRYGPGFVVETKADAKYKVVSGASVVAKVTRDSLLKELEPNCGSGYPGDPLTRLWMKKSVNPVFGYPDIVRFSWSTVDEFLPKRKSKKMRGTFKDFYLTNK